MIVIVTTINLYRTVVKGAPWEDNAGDDDDDAPKKKNLWTRLKDRFTKKRKSAKSPDGA